MKAMLAAKAATAKPAGSVAGIDESVLPADNQNAPI